MKPARNPKTGNIITLCLSIIAISGIFLFAPIPQDMSYHLYKDQRTLFAIPNFYNVFTSSTFLIVGLIGLYKLLMTEKLVILKQFRLSYLLLFSGLSLVAFGSAYYHLWPSNQTLIWDRLPMTIAFMSLFTIIISEYISLRGGKTLLLPLLIAGSLSVIYWYVTETRGAGDLRFYIVVQFLPILLIPVILIFFRQRFNTSSGYWWLLLIYILAKLFELFDGEIYTALGFISGHSLKHIAAAMGMYVLIKHYETRRDI